MNTIVITRALEHDWQMWRNDFLAFFVQGCLGSGIKDFDPTSDSLLITMRDLWEDGISAKAASEQIVAEMK